jgi:hypothetical protein
MDVPPRALAPTGPPFDRFVPRPFRQRQRLLHPFDALRRHRVAAAFHEVAPERDLRSQEELAASQIHPGGEFLIGHVVV